MPLSYQTTGVETHFTNGLDPNPRARPVFAFHRPETLDELLDVARVEPSETRGNIAEAPSQYKIANTFLGNLQRMPVLKEEGLWPAQIKAITKLLS